MSSAAGSGGSGGGDTKLASSQAVSVANSDSADFIKITSEPLETYNLQSLCGSAEAGAISTFIGTTRNHFNGKTVLRLEYEAYEPMAIKQLKLLCNELRVKWSSPQSQSQPPQQQLIKIVILHRLGVVAVGEASVMIAISSAHRKASLEACAYAIDTLKARIPIWKKEWYADGSSWKQNTEFDPTALVSVSATAPPAAPPASAGSAAAPTPPTHQQQTSK